MTRNLIALFLFGLGAASAAQAQLCVSGGVNTAVWTGVGSNYLSDSRTIGSDYVCQTQPVYTAATPSNQRYDIFPSDPLLLRQVANASVSAYAAFGGLRAAVSTETAIGNSVNNITSAGGSVVETWNDVVTFHTASPLGADFNFTITLDDGLGTNLPQGAGYARNSEAQAQAYTAFYFSSGGNALLAVNDTQTDYVPGGGTGPAAPISASNHPGERSVSALVHVFDGQSFNIAQTLRVSAFVSGFGSAYADAGDTAFFNLSSSDASATYTTASGTVFLASGDPFAVSPVPEPSEWALMMTGLGAIGFIGKRRRRR